MTGRAGVRTWLRRPAGREPALRVLLLHGLGGTGTVWRGLVERADPRWEVWDAELPWGAEWGAESGTGWTEDPEVGRWIAQAVIATPGDPPDVLVAHSFAATAVLEVLDRRLAAWPAAVVLVAPFYRPAVTDFDWRSLQHSLDAFPRLLADGVGLHARPPGSSRPLAREVQQDMARHILERIGPYGWARFLDLYLRTPRLRTERLALPVLLVAGEHDDAAAPSDAAALHLALPDSRLEVFAGCGHFPMTERPDRFAALLTEFVDAAVAPTAGTRKEPA